MGERDRILGIDLGIASCGWAVIEVGDGKDGSIVAAGVRCFDAPLVDKTGEPKSAARRGARGQRRVIRRRRQRMNAVRKLLRDCGLLADNSATALHDALRRISPPGATPQITPWQLRSAVHERRLSNDEFAIVLGHIARHRGFRSNSKRDAVANAADETSKMKKAMEETREGLAKYHSFGDMLARDEKFANRKRNRDKDYSHTAKRSDLEDEARRLFAAQRRFGNPRATADLETAFADAAFFQRPLQDSEDKVGKCPFETNEKRTARRAPSFELFRYLAKLNTLTLSVGRTDRRLSPEEIAQAARNFGEQKKITYKTLRKHLDLDPNARFSGIARNKEDLDVAARSGSAAEGSYTLRKVLGEAGWQSLSKTPGMLDRIAEILSFREDLDSIRTGFAEIGLPTIIIDQLAAAAGDGAFGDFSKAAHISAKAARNIIPGLQQGLVYSEACARVGYDHSARAAVSLNEINSPVTRRSFGEAIKQIRAVARACSPIDFVHIELARDVGKSADERKKLEKGIEDRNAEKDRRKDLAAGILGRAVSDDELLRYELAMEQTFKCVYCDGAIDPKGFAANNTSNQVDHILPWSRFGDDSYLNKTLCCVTCNQTKRRRTPFEWFSADKTEAEWEAFVSRVETLKEMKGLKKRNYRLKDAADAEEKFKARNLTDTRWATRLLADELKRMFPAPEDKRRVFTRPGAITSKLRRAWGLERLKKENGERVEDDRHHAVDAIVLAATTNSLLQGMTLEVQKRENEGKQDDIYHVSSPWPGFRLDVERAVYGEGGHRGGNGPRGREKGANGNGGGVFVSRAERRRARGKAHDATIKQIREIEGEPIVFERKPIEKLTDKDLDKIPMPAPYGKAADPRKLRNDMVESLRAWIAAGKPKALDKLPRSPKGDVIRKVRLASKDSVAIEVNGGTVDRGDMARVDVFESGDPKSRSRYLFVPVYNHQVVQETAPSKVVTRGKDYANWRTIGPKDRFLFSISKLCLVEARNGSSSSTLGYFRSLDVNDGRLSLTPHYSNSDAGEIRISPTTILELRKFTVDRLGRKFEVLREQRTWRGKTIPAPASSSSPVASSVSSVHGVERPAPDAAGEAVPR